MVGLTPTEPLRDLFCYSVSFVNDAPIGVFDSGLGGLTVTRAIIDQLPREDVIYLGDSANTPYGSRPLEEVRRLTLEGLDHLVDLGAKALVIACNTATAAALSDARGRYAHLGIPILEVIHPAARQAALATRNGHVGVLGTEATVNSRAYVDALGEHPGIEVTQSAAPSLVSHVEQGNTTGPDVTEDVQRYIRPLLDAQVDTVILGCTHYPLLTGVLSRELGPQVRLVTSSQETANATYAALVDLGLTHSPRPVGEQAQYRFYSTQPTEVFAGLARRFLGPEVLNVEGVPTQTGSSPTREDIS